MDIYKNKKVLVAGGTGLIGRPLVEKLIERGARVRIASLDDKSRSHPEAEFHRVDLTEFHNCSMVCNGMDYVFNLLCVKGSPKISRDRPVDLFDPVVLFNTNLLRAARKSGIERYLYTSSYGAYAPAEVFREDEMWKAMPDEKDDKFAGWAKRIGELQAEAYKMQYNWDKISIVRPSNTYGPCDNFSPDSAMVVPALIRRVLSGENPVSLLGDGSNVRDFIHARDVADGMLLVFEKESNVPVNLGSGIGCTIRELVSTILAHAPYKPRVIWDESKPSYGDKIRVMDISRARALGFSPQISLDEGIKDVIGWYQKNRESVNARYDIFNARQLGKI